jgi:hypothetical protein
MMWFTNSIHGSQSSSIRKWTIIDNRSILDILCNPKLVYDIRTIPEYRELWTNGGVLFTNQCADFLMSGTVWFDESAMRNIFSLAKLKTTDEVTYDSTTTPAFLVILPDKIVRFDRTP